jgi:hypothetical protein
MIQQERIMGFIDWIKQLFTSQSCPSFPSEKEKRRRDDEEEEEIEELVALEIIGFQKMMTACYARLHSIPSAPPPVRCSSIPFRSYHGPAFLKVDCGL